MADLKAGSTTGGAVIWHQGNFPLFPVGDTLLYKTFKLYSEKDKPLASDNDFVSKATGGEYLGEVSFSKGLTVTDKDGFKIKIGVPSSTSPMAEYSASMRLSTSFALENSENKPFIIFDPTTDVTKPRLIVMGKVIAGEVWDNNFRVFSPSNPPKAIDVGLGNVTNDAQVKKTGDVMSGPLSAPNFISILPATRDDHVPQFGQVISKNTSIDFGYYA